jgi:MFS family permease
MSAATAEWRQAPLLPIAAGLGYATSVIHIYGLGPYIEPISESFGWSRTQTTAGLALCTLVQAVFAVPIGIAVDRFGPRLLGLIGVPASCGAFALIGTADGTSANWWLLWLVMAAGTLLVQTTIWTSAVATRFSASRGLAFAVTLCGASIAAALFPWLGTMLIADHGWQTAMAMQAAIWAAIAFPLVLLFFRSASATPETGQGAAATVSPLAGLTLAQGLRTRAYWLLVLACLLFTFTIIAMVVHFLPILTASGLSKAAAAGVAALIGLASIVGRLGTGVLLDRFSASKVGGLIFLFPVAGCLLLILLPGDLAGAMAAATLIGLTLGAEVDVIVYLVTRHFGLKAFGALFGGLLAALSIGTAAGPLGAARVFDLTGGYEPFLWLTIAFMVGSSLALFSLPQPAFQAGEE